MPAVLIAPDFDGHIRFHTPLPLLLPPRSIQVLPFTISVQVGSLDHALKWLNFVESY
jgi:hypothetical protein